MHIQVKVIECLTERQNFVVQVLQVQNEINKVFECWKVIYYHLATNAFERIALTRLQNSFNKSLDLILSKALTQFLKEVTRQVNLFLSNDI